ncbi:MAG: formate dehydrogenase accessory sulfurtransferase FdhD [Crocinitomicaceae bacterium]|nr:formate dehydrogenase accessory sulfurtransferase FdhD [Crocinitomicaceae bacterium]
MATSDYEGKKFENGKASKIVDALTIEEALQININGEPFTVTMRTPGDDIELVRGLLHSEGIIKDRNYSPDVIIRKENENGIVTVVDLSIPTEKLGEGYSNSRSLLSVSSCGICGRKELDELSFMGKVIDEKRQLDIENVQQMFHKMNKVQRAFQQSGGSHAAAAFDMNGDMLSSKEDIGRHNAVDKVIGELILTERFSQPVAITVSGRISYEIIVKAFKARIPVLCAVSAPSTLAVDYAKELGITLLAFCREDRATCYSHPHRIKNQTLNSQAG